MTEKTYKAEEVTAMLKKSMETYHTSMVSLIRECAVHSRYSGLSGKDALLAVADKLEGLK